jgi:hypothetical protein
MAMKRASKKAVSVRLRSDIFKVVVKAARDAKRSVSEELENRVERELKMVDTNDFLMMLASEIKLDFLTALRIISTKDDALRQQGLEAFEKRIHQDLTRARDAL